jgi:hypothetical protein
MAASPATEAMLPAAKIKELQQKIGALQWYCNIAYDIVLALAKVSVQQSMPTYKTLQDANHIIKYLAGRKNTSLIFKKSNMQLNIETDASFSSELKSQSRLGAVFLVGGYDDNENPLSSPLAVHSKIPDCHPDSAAEAEYISLHDGVKEGIHYRNMLEDMGWKQSQTECRVDNACAQGLAMDTVNDKRTKHIDRRYHWLKFELKKGLFAARWKKGSTNLADFFTKYLDKQSHRTFTEKFTRQIATPDN